MLPKFKEEIKASGDLILKASDELESEKQKQRNLLKANKGLESKIKDLKEKESKTDVYIDQLQQQLTEAKQHYSTI